ncbi:Bifunctional lysine-specific demethylase and histidyl-hydroxylase NO66 [Trichostrongylus colubriformis]|uniref:Bifunctional lysine-specific demethylase and histidyl-hydroxylase n=1 Tax=Trichostrongylus colubriformis TaxID=6319 RepID=A0AAN8FBZ8_TRICO
MHHRCFFREFLFCYIRSVTKKSVAMVRRRKSGAQKQENAVKTPIIVELDETNNGAPDPWASIENGDAVAARQVFYKKPVPKEPQVKHYERFKNKKQRISDGSNAKRIEIHAGQTKGIKRRNRSDDGETIDYSPAQKLPAKKQKTGDENARINVFAGVIKGKSTLGEEKKKGRKRPRHLQEEENEKENEENLDGLESDGTYDSDEDEDYEEEIDEEDEEVEEVEDDEDEDATGGVVEDGNRSVSFVEEPSNSEDSGEVEELTDDEGVEDEEDDLNDDDVSSDEVHSSEDSEGEASLGEEREAVVLQSTETDAILVLPDFDKFPFTDEDSSVTATRAFAWMVAPCDVQSFFKDFFQSNALIAKRGTPNYYSNLYSTEHFVKLVEQNHLEYGTNINIAEYKDGVRLTMNGKGRVYPNHLKEHLSLGRSIQFVNPQTFDNRVWYLCEVLQELFGCFVGANTYLTPPGSAGFAPHWDEIDAFILQLEGRKYWKVYAPDSRENELPRESSGNFTNDDMKDRKPTFEGWIEAGDLLYVPRGFIHNALTDEDVHSLHITISTGRLWTFADLFEKLVPEAVSSLAQGRWKMRKSLPVGMLDMKGVAELDYRMEENFEDEWKAVVDRHMTALRNTVRDVCDGGIDLMARQFMRTALPPLLTPEEKSHSVIGIGTDILHGNVMEFRPSTKVKLIRRHAQRLLFESPESCYVAHRMANSRLYEGLPEQTFDLPVEFVSGFNALCNSYPEWMSLSEMPDELNGAEVQALCHLLYYHGLIMVQQLPDRIKKKRKSVKN